MKSSSTIRTTCHRCRRRCGARAQSGRPRRLTLRLGPASRRPGAGGSRRRRSEVWVPLREVGGQTENGSAETSGNLGSCALSSGSQETGLNMLGDTRLRHRDRAAQVVDVVVTWRVVPAKMPDMIRTSSTATVTPRTDSTEPGPFDQRFLTAKLTLVLLHFRPSGGSRVTALSRRHRRPLDVVVGQFRAERQPYCGARLIFCRPWAVRTCETASSPALPGRTRWTGRCLPYPARRPGRRRGFLQTGR